MTKKGETDRQKRLDAEISLLGKQGQAETTVALIYPNTYQLGMSNLGFQTVYRLLNELDGIVCERSFLPDQDVANTGDIISIESGRSISTFDIIAVSLSFENDYPNLLTIFQKAGLPFRSIQRDETHPLIIAGGVTCLLNPAPIAPFIDCFLIGEAEANLPDFMRLIQETGTRDNQLMRASQEINGIYIPSLYRDTYFPDNTFQGLKPLKSAPDVIRKAYVRDISQTPTCSAIVTPNTTFDQTYLIEVSRGCPHGCRFCGAGFVYRPPRFRDPDVLVSCMHDGRAHTDKIGLVGAAVSDLPGLEDLCRAAEKTEAVVSFSSLRADALDDDLISHLSKSNVKTATIAPDAGSERLRLCINKGLSEEDILTATKALVINNIPNLKLYFMIGLPTETMHDVDAIVDLCKKVKQVFLKSSRAKGHMGGITVSINSFVPKPHTPFQWAAMDTIQSLKRKFKHIQKGLKRVPNIRIHTDVPRWAYVQALLSRGDMRVADLLEAAHANNGNWPKTLKASVIDADFYVHRERNVDEIFPWDFIDHGIQKSYLLAEYRKALRGDTTAPCDVDVCRKCGVCGGG
jgi:radical SAM superfamily enzyme YgiQ (UPF0313 family)